MNLENKIHNDRNWRNCRVHTDPVTWGGFLLVGFGLLIAIFCASICGQKAPAPNNVTVANNYETLTAIQGELQAIATTKGNNVPNKIKTQLSRIVTKLNDLNTQNQAAPQTKDTSGSETCVCIVLAIFLIWLLIGVIVPGWCVYSGQDFYGVKCYYNTDSNPDDPNNCQEGDPNN